MLRSARITPPFFFQREAWLGFQARTRVARGELVGRLERALNGPVRLLPGGQVLYLGQLSEEELVQRLGLFSYWRARPMREELQQPLLEALGSLEQKRVAGGLLLVR